MRIVLRLGALLMSICGALAVVLASPAAATPCGTKVDGAVQRGTLALQQSESGIKSVSSLSFKSVTTSRSLVYIFTVAGCELQSDEGIVVNEISSDVSSDAFQDATLVPKGTVLAVTIPVLPTSFAAGTHDVAVTFQGPSIETSVQPATLSRRDGSEGMMYVVFAVAVLAGFIWCGLALYFATKDAGGGSVSIRPPYAVLALPVAIVAGFAVFKQTYLDSETWALSVTSALGLFLSCAAAAAGGTTSGALSKAIVKKALLS